MGPGVAVRVSMARASSSAPGYGSRPPRSHLAALQRPSKSVWQTIVSTWPMRATTLGGHHLGAGPVLGLRREDEARIAPVVLVHHVIVVVDPAGEPGAELLDERAA